MSLSDVTYCPKMGNTGGAMVPFPRQLYIRSCLLLLVSVCFAWLSNAASQTTSPADLAAAKPLRGRLVCKPCKMDFGKVHVGQSKALPVVLTNEGRVPVTIADKSKNAAWVSPDGLVLPYTLQPGRAVKFRLVYRPRDARRVNGQISYRSNAVNHVLPISVTAGSTSGGVLAANPARLDFGSIAVGNTVTKNQTITNVGNTAVTIEQITDSGSGFSVGNVTTPQTLAPGHSVTFAVNFTPQKAGTDTGSLIALSSATSYRLSVVESGTGTAGGSVSVTPSSLAFGNVSVGSSKTKTLTLTATGASMTIKSDALSSAEYTISGLSLPLKLGAGKSVSFQATFSPQTAGTANGNASFSIASPSSTIKAALSGTGTGGSQHSVTLSWKPDSSSVAGYNVYRAAKKTGPYSKLTSPLDTGTDYLDTNVSAGSTYYYEVTAVNDQGLESARTAPVGATIP
jgi:Abnormal spindle-like microcephaly-assoc'd, ASPM-SPD-2-Hydin/Fibronectin type III domain